MARNFIPLVPSGTIGADADVAQLEQDVLAMDSRVGELAEDVGTIEQWDAGDIPFDSTETYASGSVGAELTNVKSHITQLDNTNYAEVSGVNYGVWSQGWYGASTGFIDTTKTTAIASPFILPNAMKVRCASGYKFRVQGWGASGYLGIWNGSEWKTSNPNLYYTDFDLASLASSQNAILGITLYKSDGTSAVSISDASNVTFTVNTVKNIQADYTNRYIFPYGGTSLNPARHGITKVGYNAAYPGKPSGTSSWQGSDHYNGYIYTLASSNKVGKIKLDDQTLVTSFAIDSGHGNSCQFAAEVAAGETIPHLFCWGYTNKLVYENSISDAGSATLVKKYYLPIDGYRISGGLDTDRNYLMTVHYSADSSTDPTDNSCLLCVWDMSDLTDNGDDTYSPALISQTEIPFVGVVQDCKVVNGMLYVLSGGGQNNYPKYKISMYNDTTIVNSVTFESNNNEPESLFFLKTNGRYTAVIINNRLNLVTFGD